MASLRLAKELGALTVFLTGLDSKGKENIFEVRKEGQGTCQYLILWSGQAFKNRPQRLLSGSFFGPIFRW